MRHFGRLAHVISSAGLTFQEWGEEKQRPQNHFGGLISVISVEDFAGQTGTNHGLVKRAARWCVGGFAIDICLAGLII